MKQGIRVFLSGIALISLLFLVPGDVLAKKNTTLFSGEMTFSGGNCGVFTCPGGLKVAECYPPNPCSEGSNFHMRNRELLFTVTADDARASGTLAVIGNWNWRYMGTGAMGVQYSGPIWGTFILEVDNDGGGTWEGSFTGHWDGTVPEVALSFVGHGEGGDIDGMQIKMEATGGFLKAGVLGRIQ